MFSLGALTFLSPWILAALLAVPVIWWLMRVMPPQPRSVKFPAYFLLRDLTTDIKTPSHTPWWLLLLRAIILCLFIIGLADPVLKLADRLSRQDGPVLMVIDNGWASASHWKERQEKMKEFLPQIERARKNVIMLPTTLSAQDGAAHSYGPMDAADADEWISRLRPEAWNADYRVVRDEVDKIANSQTISHALFFSDGTAAGGFALREFIGHLQNSTSALTIIRDNDINNPLILRRDTAKPGELSFAVERLHEEDKSIPMTLSAYGEGGNILDEKKFTFDAGKKSITVPWDMLGELRNKVTRIDVRGAGMASASYITDSGWRQRPVGILADPSQKDSESVLNEVYYLKRALQMNGIPNVGAFDDLTQQSLSAIIWPDSAVMAAMDRVKLQEWVEAGGFLVRFAGPNLAANPEDPLLPVPLRFGQRAMEGSMTWEKPVNLGSVTDAGPLKGLAVPKDVTVTRQVLANPLPEVFEKTWLQLEDGTPLITGASMGKGYVVLVHTTAGPDWSNFCYSGLYVEGLQRMISLSNGIAGYKPEVLLPPLTLIDAFGRLYPPDAKTLAAAIDPKVDFVPAPKSPPGIYGDQQQFQVYNLGDRLPPLQAFDAKVSGATVETYALQGEESQKPDFIRWALILLMVDMIATFMLRGVIPMPVRKAAIMLVFLFASHSAIAAEPEDLASNVYLAYMETGDQDTDAISYAGLEGLRNILALRTTIKIKGVEGLNPDIDDLHYYPFIYWPMTNNQSELSATAARNIQNYLSRGGMILFDTRDRQFGDTNGATIGTQKLRSLTQTLRIPELMEVDTGHILTRSFYLLSDFPGLYDGGKLWVEKEPNPNHDAVTSVIIGGNDWASAWSRDRRLVVTPGGEKQREMAFRFGVNVAMVALAGNYKADQVHIPYILERLK